MKSSQFKLLSSKPEKSYGGKLLNTRKGRSHGRPLSTKSSMHLVLKSSHAQGEWRFNLPSNKKKIKRVIDKFSTKYGVKILSSAFVGNHLHFHIKLTSRHTYKAFIRAVTSAIAMCVTGASRWKPLRSMIEGQFWDYRPFTRLVQGFKDFTNINNYIKVNQIEGCGYSRAQARYVLAQEWARRGDTS